MSRSQSNCLEIQILSSNGDHFRPHSISIRHTSRFSSSPSPLRLLSRRRLQPSSPPSMPPIAREKAAIPLIFPNSFSNSSSRRLFGWNGSCIWFRFHLFLFISFFSENRFGCLFYLVFLVFDPWIGIVVFLHWNSFPIFWLVLCWCYHNQLKIECLFEEKGINFDW